MLKLVNFTTINLKMSQCLLTKTNYFFFLISKIQGVAPKSSKVAVFMTILF